MPSRRTNTREYIINKNKIEQGAGLRRRRGEDDGDPQGEYPPTWSHPTATHPIILPPLPLPSSLPSPLADLPATPPETPPSSAPTEEGDLYKETGTTNL